MGMSRRMKWIFGLSIALNLFLLAFIGGQVWRFHHAARMLASGQAVEMMLRQVGARLSTQDAQTLRQAFMPKLPELRELQRQARRQLEQTREDIGATPFDAAKVKADLEQARETREKIAPIVETTFLDVLPRLSGRRTLSHIRLLRGR